MHVQAFEGYWENGTFYSLGQPVRVTGRQRAILTLLDEPAREIETSSKESRIEWLERLEAAIDLSMDEELPDWPFQRSKDMRSPHGLRD